MNFKDGKLFMINLYSAMPADNQSTESSRPSKSLMSTPLDYYSSLSDNVR